jgi:opacity protein-like surface antigen
MRSARALMIVLAIALSAIGEAQTRTQPRTPARPQPAPAQPRIGLRGYVTFGSITLTATDTFDAVADTHSRPVFGGGVQVTSIWKGVFADVGVSQLTIDGERVFVSNDQVFKLGIPLEITMRPVDIAAGWRFRFSNGRVSPYGGAGLTYLTYEETSDFAGSGEDVNESKTGPLVLGGVDVQVWRWISAGGELRWRRVNGILGEGGASAEFDEDDAGGFSAAVRISIGR